MIYFLRLPTEPARATTSIPQKQTKQQAAERAYPIQ